jgi:hypothetical protein
MTNRMLVQMLVHGKYPTETLFNANGLEWRSNFASTLIQMDCGIVLSTNLASRSVCAHLIYAALCAKCGSRFRAVCTMFQP